MSYGIDQVDAFRLPARYVDRILRGAKPGDLPVQAPTKYETLINLKTAKAIGLDVPASLLVRAESDAAMARLTKAISDDQRLGTGVIGEKAYYANLTSSGAPLQVLGFSVAVIMAIGSAFAATNTMYAAVSRRAREIGTLRALGFERWTILRSFLLESVCLALIGGILGVMIALPINGLTTGVGNFVTFS